MCQCDLALLLLFIVMVNDFKASTDGASRNVRELPVPLPLWQDFSWDAARAAHLLLDRDRI